MSKLICESPFGPRIVHCVSANVCVCVHLVCNALVDAVQIIFIVVLQTKCHLKAIEQEEMNPPV